MKNSAQLLFLTASLFIPMANLGAKDSAKTPYALPGTKAMQERGWDDCATGLDTLLSGGTAEAAVEAYLQEMSKYTTA